MTKGVASKGNIVKRSRRKIIKDFQPKFRCQFDLESIGGRSVDELAHAGWQLSRIDPDHRGFRSGYNNNQRLYLVTFCLAEYKCCPKRIFYIALLDKVEFKTSPSGCLNFGEVVSVTLVL